MIERRHSPGRRRYDDQESCPLTVECLQKLISRLERLESSTENLPDITRKINELHDHLVQAKGVVAGIRIGATSVFVFIMSFIVMIYAFLTGKITLKDLITGMF